MVLLAGCSQGCDPGQVVRTLYDATDVADFQKGVTFFRPDATVTTWAEGVNGRHWQEQTHTGADQILQVLSRPGFRRASPREDLPTFSIANVSSSPGRISFWLRPDRTAPNGRPYDPYHVVATVRNCTISTMTVTEFLSWE